MGPPRYDYSGLNHSWYRAAAGLLGCLYLHTIICPGLHSALWHQIALTHALACLLQYILQSLWHHV